MTGVPSSQRTVAFEKASVLFNIGGLYTQIGTRQDRGTAAGLDNAVDNYLRAAGTFQYIHENFTNAPSMDLGPDTLHMLVQLMCAQARECLFEKTELAMYEKEEADIDSCLELGQEAAHVSNPCFNIFIFPQRSNCPKEDIGYQFIAFATQAVNSEYLILHCKQTIFVLAHFILSL